MNSCFYVFHGRGFAAATALLCSAAVFSQEPSAPDSQPVAMSREAIAAAGTDPMPLARAREVLLGHAPKLLPGHDAPAPAVGGWVQGDAVDGWRPGEIYVIEMWATWCVPCIYAMPHLHELSEQYDGKVTFIGLNVAERGKAAGDAQVRAELIRGFVDKHPELSYRVAFDDGREMLDGWLRATGRSGIPATFVVDGKGKLAWTGNPLALDEPLRKIVAGEVDYEASQYELLASLAERACRGALRSARLADGLELLEAIARACPADHKAVTSLCDELMRSPQNRTPAAVAKAEQMLLAMVRPDASASALALKSLGNVYWSIHRFEDAIEQFGRYFQAIEARDEQAGAMYAVAGARVRSATYAPESRAAQFLLRTSREACELSGWLEPLYV